MTTTSAARVVRHEGSCGWCGSAVALDVRPTASSLVEVREEFDLHACPICGWAFPLDMRVSR